MLVDPLALRTPRVHPILTVLATVMGRGRTRRRIKQGIYEMVHFSMDIELWGSNNFEQSRPEIPGVESEYGVCDSPEQFEELLGPLIQKDPRYFKSGLANSPGTGTLDVPRPLDRRQDM